MFASFHVPPTLLIGGGSRQELVPVVRRLGGTRALLVTDATLMEEGVSQHFVSQLTAAGVVTAVHCIDCGSSSEQKVVEGNAAMRSADADCVVAVGGGSVIDSAKAIAVFATNHGVARDFVGENKVLVPAAPLIALPTTSGSGSEVTRSFVLEDRQRKERLEVASPHCVAAAAIVDYELTLTQPSPLTASVGLETLAHGIEAYVSRRANGLTNPLALACVKLVGQHLVTAYSEPNQRFARAGMSLAACQGGMATSNASGGLVQAMSQPLSAQLGVPQGVASAVLLPIVTKFSLRGSIPRYAAASHAFGAAKDADSDGVSAAKLVLALEELNRSLHLPKLREHPGLERDVFDALLPRLAADAMLNPAAQHNPVVPSAEEIVGLYREAW
ncbi:MAG: iron-containing alcohol dehydrogenase [Verrucomicrobia bacterium]|nr:iron-containing alcohol dehydrogenase [Verrucomicrobiota bacterium]